MKKYVKNPDIAPRLPVFMSRDELAGLFPYMYREHLLLAQLLYGNTGMRLPEGLQLRFKDVDFSHRTLIVRAGIGGQDSEGSVPLDNDQAEGHGGVEMPIWCRRTSSGPSRAP